MKRKIKVTLNGRTTSSEVEIRNSLHFDIQKNTRAVVFKDKTKYNRKIKHKNKEE